MSARCTFRLDDGKFCRRWAGKGLPFCAHHTPAAPAAQSESENIANLSPLDRLNTHDDVFDVVRETLNAIRLGRVSPGRAYATGYFIDLWLRVHERMEKVGPETKKFQKRRRMSDAVEQATFDMVAEKVVQVITGRTIEQIEQDGGRVTRDGEKHWVERPLAVIDELLGVRAAIAADKEAAAAAAKQSAPAGPQPPSVPSSPQTQQDGQQQSQQPYPLPRNWGREEENKN